jgi:hypothetical protein
LSLDSEDNVRVKSEVGSDASQSIVSLLSRTNVNYLMLVALVLLLGGHQGLGRANDLPLAARRVGQDVDEFRDHRLPHVFGHRPSLHDRPCH